MIYDLHVKTYSCLAGQKLPTFYGIQNFITVFSEPRNWTLS